MNGEQNEVPDLMKLTLQWAEYIYFKINFENTWLMCEKLH